MRRIEVVEQLVLASLLVVTLSACSSSGPTGSLTVTVGGLPAGVDGAVTVSGPGGTDTRLTSSSTLNLLTPGSYVVSGAFARAPASVVGAAYAPSGGGTVEVRANATSTSSVTYSLLAGSGKLWVADQAAGIVGLSAHQLAKSASATPAVVLKSYGRPDGLAFDSHGNLWVGMTSSRSLVEFTASQLTLTATPSPSVSIGPDATALFEPISLAFDGQGDLWVANCKAGIEMYTPAQLAVSGNPDPAVAITGSYSCVSGLAFDTAGDLWVSDTHHERLVELTPDQLDVSGSPKPHAVLTSSALSYPEGLTFDANGNLWVANELTTGPNALTMFTAAQVAAGGSQPPTVAISDDGSGNLHGAVYAALDDSGDLWVTSYGGSGGPDVLEYAAADIATTGSPSPAVVLTGFAGFNWPQLAFDPAPSLH